MEHRSRYAFSRAFQSLETATAWKAIGDIPWLNCQTAPSAEEEVMANETLDALLALDGGPLGSDVTDMFTEGAFALLQANEVSLEDALKWNDGKRVDTRTAKKFLATMKEKTMEVTSMNGTVPEEMLASILERALRSVMDDMVYCAYTINDLFHKSPGTFAPIEIPPSEQLGAIAQAEDDAMMGIESLAVDRERNPDESTDGRRRMSSAQYDFAGSMTQRMLECMDQKAWIEKLGGRLSQPYELARRFKGCHTSAVNRQRAWQEDQDRAVTKQRELLGNAARNRSSLNGFA